MQNQISTSQELKFKRYLKQKVRVLKNGMQTNYWRGKRQSVASVPDLWMLRNCTYYQWSIYSSRSAFRQGAHFCFLCSNEMFGEKTIHAWSSSSSNNCRNSKFKTCKRLKEFVTLSWLDNQITTIGKIFLYLVFYKTLQ